MEDWEREILASLPPRPYVTTFEYMFQAGWEPDSSMTDLSQLNVELWNGGHYDMHGVFRQLPIDGLSVVETWERHGSDDTHDEVDNGLVCVDMTEPCVALHHEDEFADVPLR